jgi:predicted TIM-barrel fold metal-dependent hydrolase
MVIDFHTHVFPDNLAARAISVLSEGIENLFPPVNNGTVSGLIHDMDNWNIDISIVQPVVTKQSQTKSINDWSHGICSDRLISFGGIYPHTDDYKRDIDYIVELGLKGLKFHAEYQDFIVDDDKMLKIYDYALGKGLILLHHAGADPAFKPPFKSTPQQFAKIAKTMQGGIIVAAHFGGHAQWDDVEKYLVGTDIYLDTSMGFEFFPHEQFLRIVKKHGADKILFASDYPWSNAKSEIEQLKALPLSGKETGAILGENAKRILKL